MRISINLSTRPFADLGPALKRLRIMMAVLAVVAIALGFGLHALHHKAEEARAREHSLDSQIAGVTQERQGYENLMRKPDNAQILAQAAALNKLFDEKSFSWTLAMEDLETVLPGGVMATTLEPTRAKNGTITLQLRVTGPRDKAVDLVHNLEHSRHFLLPRIVGESAEATGGAGQVLEPVSTSNRVNFQLLADYNPVTLAELKPPKKNIRATDESATSTTHHVARGATRPQGSGPGLRRPPYAGIPLPQRSAKPHALKPRAGGPQ
jgi:type IV pilus assembly protein PilN